MYEREYISREDAFNNIPRVRMEWLRTVTAVWTFVIVNLASNITALPENDVRASPILLNYEDTNASANSGFNPDKAYVDPTAAALEAEVELSISEIYRLDGDTGFRTDPIMCQVYMQSNFLIELYSSEIVIENGHPKFVQNIRIPYLFGESQTLVFIFHREPSSPTDAECRLGELVQQGSMKIPLKGENSRTKEDDLRGYIIVKIEKVTSYRVVLQLNGKNIANKNWHQLLSPYIEIYKPTEEGEHVLIYRTEVAKTMLYGPQWKTITMPALGMCDDNYKLELKFVCWNWHTKDKRYFVGEFEATLDQLFNQKQKRFDLKNRNVEESQSKYENSGQINVAEIDVFEVPSLAEFIQGGLKIHCMIGIDFTVSNGELSLPSSLHRQDPEGGLKNPYEKLLTSFSAVIEEYNPSISVKGFGARFKNDEIRTVHHDFNVNLTMSPRCFGVKGVLQAYRNCLNHIVFSGPKFYDLIIRSASQTAKEFTSAGNDYLILLILTNGPLKDVTQFKEAIQRTNSLPISIIVVSVSGGQTSRSGETSDHVNSKEFNELGENIQFSRFDQYSRHGENDGLPFVREILGKVQGQMTSYMRLHGSEPKQPLFAHPPVTDES